MLAKDLGEKHVQLGKKTRDFDARRVKDGKLENGLAALHDGPKTNEKKIERLESQVSLDTTTTAHLATLVKAYRSNCLCKAFEIRELRRRVNDMEGNTFEAVLKADLLQAKARFMIGERDAFAAKFEKDALKVQCIPGLAEKAWGLHACVAKLR